MGLDTTGLYKRTMQHLSTRMLFHDELGPPPICSIGCLIANLRQRDEPFHWVGGDDEDLGLNLTFVGPSGMSKSHAMKQFIMKNNGLLPSSIKRCFRGKITEAGFIGTIKEGEPKYGDAKRYATGIIGFNEISNLFFAQQQEHSSELINQVMEALSERHVSKSLGGAEPLEYDTWVTIWGGVQPKRFDFSQGLGRRFYFVARNWTFADLQRLKDRRKDRSSKSRIDLKEVQGIRDEIDKALKTFSANDVSWDDRMLNYIYDESDSHLEMALLERIVIGREVMDQYENDVVHIRFDDTNKYLVDLARSMQMMVAEGSDGGPTLHCSTLPILTGA